MQFTIIDAEKRLLRNVECESLHDALRDAGLEPGSVDHGTVQAGIAIVVYEFGLFEPERLKHFAIDRSVYAGSAVLYGYDPSSGESVSVRSKAIAPYIRFLGNADETEAAIASGVADRPKMAVNGVVTWQWSKHNKKRG